MWCSEWRGPFIINVLENPRGAYPAVMRRRPASNGPPGSSSSCRTVVLDVVRHRTCPPNRNRASTISASAPATPASQAKAQNSAAPPNPQECRGCAGPARRPARARQPVDSHSSPASNECAPGRAGRYSQKAFARQGRVRIGVGARNWGGGTSRCAETWWPKARRRCRRRADPRKSAHLRWISSSRWVADLTMKTAVRPEVAQRFRPTGQVRRADGDSNQGSSARWGDPSASANRSDQGARGVMSSAGGSSSRSMPLRSAV